MAYKVWCFFIESFEFCWTCPSSTVDLLQSWHGLKFSKEGRKLWKLIPHAVFWMLWKTRNELIFRSASCSFQEIIIKIKGVLYGWRKGLGLLGQFHFQDLVFGWERVVQAL
ncbi:hypothetical protein BVC80_1169g48 [Macleaya cordata]|uniref:Reverse transcriptase zinc-binding domain n=1 Tax=Macleaya cordata TaxID=56857 RepID=A0A200QMB9_MACCD|nr:hypothetical protein BVC80_1169g48 [Macleaya cordata]